jgi:hypothetical protein
MQTNLYDIENAGTHRKVTDVGLQVLNKSVDLTGAWLEHVCILVRECTAEEAVLKDGIPEYHVIDGNHRVWLLKHL